MIFRVCRFFFAAFFASAAMAKVHVVTSLTMLADFVSAVGGDAVEVSCLLPPNAEPHTYEPRPSDLAALAHADLIVVNGLGLESWADRLMADPRFSGRIVRAGEGSPRLLPWPENAHGETPIDPHAWQNPKNVEHYATTIRDALCKLDPADQEKIAYQTREYISRLRALDVYAREQFAQIPPARRVLVTSHDALRYLADAYDFRLVPIAGTQPDREPSARELANIIEAIRKAGVPAIFVERTSSPRLAQTIADDTHVQQIATLFTDSLGTPDSDGATYLAMFRSNVDTIVRALK